LSWQSRISPFWALNLAAWSAYGFVSFAGALPYVGTAPHLSSLRVAFVNRFGFAFMALLSTGLLRLFLRRQRVRAAGPLATAALAIPLSYAAGLAGTAAANWAREAAGGQAIGGLGALGGAVSASAVILCWCACYFAVHTYREMLEEQQNALRAQATATEARWTALRGQLNPHFLFNSLNSIQALIEENPAGAERAVGQLASLLRYSLGQTRARPVSLLEEIEVIGQYLAIEKMRFEENLIVRVDVEPSAMEWPVPGFLLHPLVENAVRYGMQTSTLPLEVCIRASTSDGNLCLEVANTGRWLGAHDEASLMERTGLGLRLVREHLEQSYPGRYRSSCAVDDGWVVQRIEIAALPRGRRDASSRPAGR
jgi:hypothetical protein